MRVARKATVAELAQLVDAKVIGDSSKLIDGVSTLQNAGGGDISFLSSPKYKKYLRETEAGAVLVTEDVASDCPVVAIVCANPYLAYAIITHYLTSEGKPKAGIHPTAVISDTAKISKSARIDANVVIGDNTVVSDAVWIGAGSVIGSDCVIDEETRIFPNVTFYNNVVVGKDCVFHSGSVVGSDGFGLAKDGRRWVRIPQIGGVKIGDRVDVGANTTIDGGALEPTVLEDGVKLDNQVHIAHNCRVGENTAFAGKVAMAGSSSVGKDCSAGGGVAINGHVSVCDNVLLSGYTMVTKSITEPGAYASILPAQEFNQWRKNVANFRQLDKLKERIKTLEAQIAKLEPGD